MRLVKQTIRLPKTYTVSPEGAEQARNLLACATAVVDVVGAATQEIAVACGRDLRKHLNEVEKVRKELTAPLLEAQRKLKALADDHCGPIKAELTRIEGLVAEFQRQEAERVAAEERERQAEIERLRVAALPPAPAPDELATIKAEQAAYDAEQARQELIEAPLPAVTRTNGMRVAKVLRWECVDIKALYAARPDLCNPPTPRASEIQRCCLPELPVPGLKLWWEDRATITSARGL